MEETVIDLNKSTQNVPLFGKVVLEGLESGLQVAESSDLAELLAKAESAFEMPFL